MKEALKYQYSYPHYLQWSSRMWVLKAGDKLKSLKDESIYNVIRSTYSPVPGKLPTIELMPEVED